MKSRAKTVTKFFESNNTIYKGQYGFRPKHSCEHALLDAQNYLLHTLDKKEIALLLLIDFSKAFDMVDHDILLKKLYFYGVRGLAHDWLRSYLFDRSQYVFLNGKKSSTRKLEFGVPQGSILGPLLFVLYINDLPNIDKSIHFILYADDANIVVTGKTLEIIQKKIQKFIPQLLNWINSNALKLNIDKTKYMLFSNTSKYDINIEINDTKIKRVTQDKFLGVLIDEKLTWAAHKVAIAKKSI